MSIVAGITLPPLTNQHIATAAGITAQKLQHQKTVSVELAEAGSAVLAITKLLTSSVSTGTLRSFEATIVVQATGADRTVTVELLKSTGGGAFATVLSTTVDITDSTVILVPTEATIDASKTTVADGDIFEITVVVVGVQSAQAKGLVATLVFDENPIG